MKEVFIISTGDIVRSKTAGSQRVMNVARSLAAGNVNVYLCSYDRMRSKNIVCREFASGISYLQSADEKANNFMHLIIFLRSVSRLMSNRCTDQVIYLYPTVFVVKDFIYLIWFKLFKRYKIYCDINELRSTNVKSVTPSAGIIRHFIFLLKSAVDHSIYKLSEFQVIFYDGIVVISSNLNKYFSRFAKKLIQVPILCDVSAVSADVKAISYDYKLFKICFAGYIDCKKEGFDIMFDALGELNINHPTDLYLYGILSDTERQTLDSLKKRFGVEDRVVYIGNVEPDSLYQEFLKYHLLILPRPMTLQASYGFSTKLSEYLVSGVPVLVTDVSDNSLYIKDKINGFVIPPGSKRAMVNKILEIMSDYNSVARLVAEEARKTVREKLDYRLFTSVFTDFFFKN